MNKSQYKNWLPFIILIIGIISQATFVCFRGITFGLDSTDYLRCWEDVRNQGYLPFLLSNRINKYFFYCFLGGSLLKLHTIITLQILAAGCIPFLLYLSLRKISLLAAIIAAVFPLLIPDLYRWTPYVLTDTFFIAANAVMIFAISRISHSASSSRLIFIALVVTLCSLTRVAGLLFPLFLGIFIALFFLTTKIFNIKPNLSLVLKRLGTQFFVYGIAIMLFFSIIAPSGGGFLFNKGEDFLGNIKQGFVFYGLEGGPKFPMRRISSSALIAGLDIAKLLAIRAFYFFLPVYSHHSIRHQIVNSIVFFTLYILAIYGAYGVIKQRKKDCYLLVGMSWAMIIYHLLLNMYVNVEPDHRLLVPVFPGMIILASLGLNLLLYKRGSAISHNKNPRPLRRL